MFQNKDKWEKLMTTQLYRKEYLTSEEKDKLIQEVTENK